jgi:putative sigma-54 modulation protein
MEIDITTRHFDVTPGLRDHVLGKIGKLDKFTLKIVACHVVFDVQRFRQVCEIVLLGKNLRLTAREETSDLYASLDAAVANLQKQLARYHEKIKRHRPRHGEAPAKKAQRL